MPGGSRRTAAPAPSRSALRVKWDNKRDEIRLLKLVKSNADYKATFFPTGMARREQYKVGRDLAIDFLKDDVDQIRDWRRRGLIEKDSKGNWKAVNKTWDSRVSNPVMTKLRELKKSYEVAHDKYQKRLNPSWTKFSEIPTPIRVDLVDICPFYFHLKPLFAKNSANDEHPPIRTPSPAASRRPPVNTGRSAGPTVGAPPTPSLSPSPPPIPPMSLHPQSPLPRPGPSDAGPSISVFTLRPTQSRPIFEHSLEGQQGMLPGVSISPDTASDGSSSTDQSSTSEHDMENDWAGGPETVSSNDDLPTIDWLNLRQDLRSDPGKEVPQASEGPPKRKREFTSVSRSSDGERKNRRLSLGRRSTSPSSTSSTESPLRSSEVIATRDSDCLRPPPNGHAPPAPETEQTPSTGSQDKRKPEAKSRPPRPPIPNQDFSGIYVRLILKSDMTEASAQEVLVGLRRQLGPACHPQPLDKTQVLLYQTKLPRVLLETDGLERQFDDATSHHGRCRAVWEAQLQNLFESLTEFSETFSFPRILTDSAIECGARTAQLRQTRRLIRVAGGTLVNSREELRSSKAPHRFVINAELEGFVVQKHKGQRRKKKKNRNKKTAIQTVSFLSFGNILYQRMQKQGALV